MFTMRPSEELSEYTQYLSRSSSAIFASIQLLTGTIASYSRPVKSTKSVDSKSFDGDLVDKSIQSASSAEGMLRSIDDKNFDGTPVDDSAKSSFSAKEMFCSLLDCCFKRHDNHHKVSVVSPPPPLSPPVKIGFPADDLLSFARRKSKKQLFKDLSELSTYQESYDAHVASSKNKDGAACREAYIELISKMPGVVHPSPAKKGSPDSVCGPVQEQKIVNLVRDGGGAPGVKSAFTRVSSSGLFKNKGQSSIGVSTSDGVVIGVLPNKRARPG